MERAGINGTAYETESWSPPANSVGTSLEFAAVGSGPYANVAELVPSGFFCPQNTFFWGKHTSIYLDLAKIDKFVICIQDQCGVMFPVRFSEGKINFVIVLAFHNHMHPI